MEDEIKTLAEYQSLAREYEASDSVSRRESIEDAVYNKAKVLLHELIELYSKYDKNYVYASEFQENCGELSLAEFDEDKVWLHYSDRWSYGGECDIGIEVPMRYLDSDEMEALEKGLREEHTERVKRLIQEKKDVIAQMKKEVEALETEVKELGTEEMKAYEI